MGNRCLGIICSSLMASRNMSILFFAAVTTIRVGHGKIISTVIITGGTKLSACGTGMCVSYANSNSLTT